MGNNFYQRTLELISVITEELGESIKEINNYNWKSNSNSLHDRYTKLGLALKELNQIDSPLKELKDLIMNEQSNINKLVTLTESKKKMETKNCGHECDNQMQNYDEYLKEYQCCVCQAEHDSMYCSKCYSRDTIR
jgi:hypothetical protein